MLHKFFCDYLNSRKEDEFRSDGTHLSVVTKYTSEDSTYFFTGKDLSVYIETYLEPSRTSTMEVFCENSWKLLAVNYFHKKAPPLMFGKVRQTPLDICDGYSLPRFTKFSFKMKKVFASHDSEKVWYRI